MRKALTTLGILLGFWASADASTFTVSSTADSGAGSLRQALLDAEAASGPDEINFAGVTGTITLASILPTLTGELIINGPGAATLKISGNNQSQLLAISPGGVVRVSGMTFADGRAEGAGGGAILNSGDLTISNCRFTSNTAVGAFGGAIYNNAELTASQSEFSNNRCLGTSAVRDAKGGALFSAAGSIALNDCVFTQNSAVGVAGLTAEPPTAGGSAFGGALFIDGGTASLTRVRIALSTLTGGVGGSATGFATGTLIGREGGVARGSALFVSSGSVTVSQSTLQENSCTGGSGGSGHYGGGPGGESAGGGIMNHAGQLTVTDTALLTNRLQGGTGGGAGSGNQPGKGGAALGGGVASSGSSTDIRNTTFSGNLVIGGNGSTGSGPGGSAPGIAGGGGLYHGSGNLSVLNCTLALNEARPGITIPFGFFGNRIVGERFGGGIYAPTSSPVTHNSLFSGNLLRVVVQGSPTTTTPSDGHGIFASFGHNLFETEANISGLVSTDLVNVAALIKPLANNGGPTSTHELATGSPALDAGDSGSAPPVDQRGETRPQGPAADIGAYEQSALTLKLNGVTALSGAVTENISSTLTLESPYTTGAIVYTLDGTTPTLSSTPYTGPVAVRQSAVIRAVAYGPFFSAIASAGPVELTIIPGVNLALTKSGEGTVLANPASGPYLRGSNVMLTAVPASGWKFAGWSGDLSGITSPATLTMDGDKSVHATFVVIPTYILEVSTVGSGVVTASPVPGSYKEGTTVSLSAQPSDGWIFAGWSGDAEGAQNPLTVTLTANKSVQAIFRRIVSFTTTTKGGGSIQVSPIAPHYTFGQTVTLTAQTAPGWQFLAWRGDAESTDATLQVVLDGDTTIEAVFATSVTFTPVGGGSIVVDPAVTLYPYGSVIRLSAFPSAGNRFHFWGSPVNSENNPTEFNVTVPNPNLSAVFIPLGENEAALTVTAEGRGRVSVSPPGNYFTIGTQVTLTAVAAPGSQFTGWSGDASGSVNPLGLNLDGSKVITAKFIQIPQTTLAYKVSDPVPGEPEGTTFTRFGTPAINDASQLAFRTEIQHQGFKRSAIFAGRKIVVRQGETAPNEAGSPQLLLFKDFLEPVQDEAGHVAFTGTVIGSMIPGSSAGIWSDAEDSVLRQVALKGGDAPDVPAARFASFSSVSLQDGEVLFIATLEHGSGITPANDRGIWLWNLDTGSRLLMREGVTQVITRDGLKTVKKFSLLPSVSGSLAQGRSHVRRASGKPALCARVTFTDRTQAILEDDGAGYFRLEALASTGMPVGSALAETWASFGFPGWSLDGTRLGFLAKMNSTAVKTSGYSGIVVDDEQNRLSLRVREGDPAPDLSASPIVGATFARFKDPVIGGSPLEFAFAGRLRGKGVGAPNDDGIWIGTAEGLRLLAREGQPNAVIPRGARWKTFKSLALGSARGPLFVANLAPGFGGVTPATSRGLWGMDSAGQLRSLLRQGDSIQIGEAVVQVQRFTALSPATGAEGTVRGLSAAGAHIVVQAQLSDGSKVLLKIEIP